MTKWLKFSDARAGMKVMVDIPSACTDYQPCVRYLQANATGDLYFSCKTGQHHLDGQVDPETDECVGITEYVDEGSVPEDEEVIVPPHVEEQDGDQIQDH